MLTGLRDSIIPVTRGGRILAAGAMVDSFGTGMFLAAATLYFVGLVHLPAAQVAGAMSAGAVCGLVSPPLICALADRYGALRTYVVVMCLRCLISAAFPFINDIAGFLLLTCLLTGADRPCSPLLQIIVTEVVGSEQRSSTMASIRSARNIGVTVGLLAAGVVVGIGSRAAFTAIFLTDAASYLVIAALVARANRAASPPPRTATSTAPVARSPLRNLRFLVFTAANGLLSLYDSMLVALLPIWLIQATVLHRSWLGLLLAVNTVLTVLIQGYVARYARTVDGAFRLLWCAAGTLVAGCALFALAQHSPLVPAILAAIGAVVAITLAENIHLAASWELSDALAPPGARGRYLGVFSMGLSGERIVGPVLLVAVLLPLGEWAWVLLAPVFALSAGVAVRTGRQAYAETRPSPGE